MLKSLINAFRCQGSLKSFEPKTRHEAPADKQNPVSRDAQRSSEYAALVVAQLQDGSSAKLKLETDLDNPYLGPEIRTLVQAHFTDRKLLSVGHRVGSIYEIDYLLLPTDVPTSIELQIEASRGKYGFGQIEYQDMKDWIGPSNLHHPAIRYLQGSDLLDIELRLGVYELRDHARYTAKGVNPSHVIRSTKPAEIRETLQNLTGLYGIAFVPPPVISALKESDYAERGTSTEIGVMLSTWTQFQYSSESYAGYRVLVELGSPEHVNLEKLQDAYASDRVLKAGDRRLVNGVWKTCVDPNNGQWEVTTD